MKEDLEPDFKIKNILCDVGSPCGADDLIKALESKGLSLGFKMRLLRVVQTQTILFLKSMSARVGSDIERLLN